MARKALMAILCVLATYGYGFLKGEDAERAKVNAEHLATTQRIEKERDDVQKKLNASAKKWAEDQARSESLASGTVDRLTESNVRLSVKLADAKRGEVEGYNRGLANGRAELHRETSEALVRITQDADRHVKALQGAIREVTHE